MGPSPRDAWELDNDRRQALAVTEWKALDAWWEAYKIALREGLTRIDDPSRTVLDIANGADRDYRARRAACLAACTKIYEGLQPRPPL